MHCVKRKDKGVNAGPGGREKGRVNQMSNDPAIRKQLSSLEGTVLLFSKTSRAIKNKIVETEKTSLTSQSNNHILL